MAHGPVREWLLLAFTSKLRESANTEDQRRILVEETFKKRGTRQGDRQAPEKVRLAVRRDLGMPGERSGQAGQNPPALVRPADA
jgi:hypothetical protein